MKSINNETSLASICIITYNSRKTVIETLESAFGQTYPRLELIVSDDCSTDDTTDVCNHWIATHKDRFERTEIIVRETNGGVATNLNTAILACRGEWIKTIAGDDILLPDCIQDNMEYVRQNSIRTLVFSRMHYFREEKNELVYMDYYKPADDAKPFFDLSPEQQYIQLLESSCCPSPAAFQNREFALDHPFPEEYSFCEDWPHWTRLAKSGIKLQYFDKVTVLYRTGDTLSQARGRAFVNERFHQSLMAFFFTERYPTLLSINRPLAIKQRKELFLGETAIVLLNNRKNFFTRAVLFVIKLFVGTRVIN